MTQAEFKQTVSSLTKVKNTTGSNTYAIVRVTNDKVYFIRGGKTSEESIKLEELYDFYVNAESYTTSEAKMYISGRVQSPSVAIVKTLATKNRGEIAFSDLSNSIKKETTTKSDNRDEIYVISLCDEVLGKIASTQHRFDFLLGDGNKPVKLPVDAYYEDLNLVVEYRERQHTESVAFFNHKNTVSGVSRDEQRAIYDQRRRDVLPKHGIKLIEISYSDFNYDSRKRICRNREYDRTVIKDILKDFL